MVFMLFGMNALLRIRKRVFRQTQVVMAGIAGVDQSTWSRWERGVRSPTLEELGRVRSEAIRLQLPWDDAFFFTLSSKNKRQRATSQKRGADLTPQGGR